MMIRVPDQCSCGSAGISGIVEPLPPPTGSTAAQLYQSQVDNLNNWYQRYVASGVARSAVDQAIQILRGMGYSVTVTGRSEDLCSTAAGCVDWIGDMIVLSKDGFSIDSMIGDRYQLSIVNSPQELAEYQHRYFESQKLDASSYSSQPASYAEPQQTAPSYRRDAELSLPDGAYVGGRFVLRIWGRPNSEVKIWASQSGREHGTTPYGMTDGSGYKEISGTFGQEHAGDWHERIYVGGELVRELRFSIQNRPQQPVNTIAVQQPAPAPAPAAPSSYSPPPPAPSAGDPYSYRAEPVVTDAEPYVPPPAYTDEEGMARTGGFGIGIVLLAAAAGAAYLLLSGGDDGEKN